MTSLQGPANPWPMLAPVGLFVFFAAALVVAPAPPPIAWLAPICFGAFASLILLWRSGAPVIVQSGISMLIITELLVIGVRSDGLGMRHVETKVSGAIESSDAPSDRIEAPVAGASRVSIATASAEANREADELSRRIQRELPDHYSDGDIQGRLRVDRQGGNTRLALSWSVGPAGSAVWCGSTSVFASDAQAGIALLASQVARKLTARRDNRPACRG
ncbi:MAG TPA: hypothetical protein VF409_00435 [Sphingomonas sp.]